MPSPGFQCYDAERNLQLCRSRAEQFHAVSPESSSSYTGPLAVVTTLFFMWGFLTCLNDILVPHLKPIFDLNYTEVMLIQFAFFGAYFLFSIPSAKIIDWIGYQRSMVVGLLTMGAGAFLFVPAASVPSLSAISGRADRARCRHHLLAGGGESLCDRARQAADSVQPAEPDAGVQFAGNVSGAVFRRLADSERGAQDDGRDTRLAPDALQAYRLHEAATVKTPYVGLGIALVVLAIAIGSFKLPKIPHAQHKVGEKVNDSIWRHRNLMLGAIGIFVYVGAEVSIGSFLVNYFSQPEIGGLTEKVAASFVAFYWGGAMVGRFIGSGLLQKMKTGQLLGICAVCAAALVAISMLSTGHFAMWSIILVGFFNSIMFPSIFTLGVAELGPLTGDGSGIMIMAIVGGAIIPIAQGAIADQDRNSPCLFSSRDLLSLHSLLRCERFEAKQRTPRPELDGLVRAST